MVDHISNRDLILSKKLLEDITGVEIKGYRAPSFSINDGILGAVEECGYLYDSSYDSFQIHDRYGHANLNCEEKGTVACQINNGFFELPIIWLFSLR